MTHSLVQIARDALSARVFDEPYAPPERSDASQGVFVTLHSPDGSLRGCIGHLAPTHERLVDEIVTCAVAAGTTDPRFPPVTRGELDDLVFELSLLTEPQKVLDRSTLDCKQHGIIVVAAQGRRGVLLPNLDGVDTVSQQIEICRRKGRIRPEEPVELWWFEIVKIEEDTPEDAPS